MMSKLSDHIKGESSMKSRRLITLPKDHEFSIYNISIKILDNLSLFQ